MGFAPNTLVRTPRGFVEIKDLNISDEVCSIDIENSRVVRRRIINKVTTAAVAAYAHIVTDYDELDTALSAPFFVTFAHGWCKAFELGLRDTLFGLRRGRVAVEDIDIKGGPIELINIGIDGEDRTFLVGQDEIVVHNNLAPLAEHVGRIAIALLKPTVREVTTRIGTWLGFGAAVTAKVALDGISHDLATRERKYNWEQTLIKAKLVSPEKREKISNEIAASMLTNPRRAYALAMQAWDEGIPTALIKDDLDYERVVITETPQLHHELDLNGRRRDSAATRSTKRRRISHIARRPRQRFP